MTTLSFNRILGLAIVGFAGALFLAAPAFAMPYVCRGGGSVDAGGDFNFIPCGEGGGGGGATVTATLTATPSTIYSGDPSSLTWSSTHATSCTGTNFSTGNATSGTVNVSPTSTQTYTVTCTGNSGSANDSEIVTVQLAVSCSPTPSSVAVGGSATWSSVVTGGGGSYTYSWSGSDSLSGSSASVAKSYSSAGTKSASVSVTDVSSGTSGVGTCSTLTVTATQCSDGTDNDGDGAIDTADSDCGGNPGGTSESTPVPTATLSADPSQVVSGESSTLTWDCSANTTSASINTSPVTNLSPANGNGTVSTGTLTDASNNFQLTCTNASGSGTAVAVVTTTNPTGTITATPDRVLAGTESALTWACYPEALSSSVSGTNGFGASAPSGTDIASDAITTQTIFSLTCDGVVVDTAIVNVSTNVDEF